MRALKITALLLLAAFLGGCTQARQVESIAFAIILGADLTEEGNIYPRSSPLVAMTFWYQ